jgi:PHD/YefM family antitoxin component YafN of YafNO toxin-antitoxin module
MTVKVDGTDIMAEALREVEENDAQVVVERDGRPIAVLVSSRFLKVFNDLSEELENRMDLEAYRRAKRESAEHGEKPIPYEEFRKELDL